MIGSLLTSHCLEKYFHLNLFNSRYCHFVRLVLISFLLPELKHNVTGTYEISFLKLLDNICSIADNYNFGGDDDDW